MTHNPDPHVPSSVPAINPEPAAAPEMTPPVSPEASAPSAHKVLRRKASRAVVKTAGSTSEEKQEAILDELKKVSVKVGSGVAKQTSSQTVAEYEGEVDLADLKLDASIDPRSSRSEYKEAISIIYSKIPPERLPMMTVSRSENPALDLVVLDGVFTKDVLEIHGIKRASVIFREIKSREEGFKISVERNCAHGKLLTREEKINAVMKLKDTMTQEELGALVGADQTTVSKWIKREEAAASKAATPVQEEPVVSPIMKNRKENVRAISETVEELKAILRKFHTKSFKFDMESVDNLKTKVAKFQAQIAKFYAEFNPPPPQAPTTTEPHVASDGPVGNVAPAAHLQPTVP